MQVTIPLNRMNLSEKLQALEDIWDDLCHSQESIPSPEWHKDVLQERERTVREGRAKFLTVDEAKRKIQGQIE